MLLWGAYRDPTLCITGLALGAANGAVWAEIAVKDGFMGALAVHYLVCINKANGAMKKLAVLRHMRVPDLYSK